jgi:predicted NACHT family NTPase
LTCRIAAREYAFEQFTEVEMADFNQHQIEAFASRWFGLQGEQPMARAFVAKLRANKPLFELASSPLLLTLLCLVFQERNDFDGTRADLYSEGLDVLLRKWDAKRSIERDLPYGLSISDMGNLLEEIAFRRFLDSEYFFDQISLEKHIETSFRERSSLEIRPGTQVFQPRVRVT